MSRFIRMAESIAELRHVFKECSQKIPPSLYAIYGELRTAAELEKRFPNAKIDLKGGQSRSDISLLMEGKKLINIEIKTSNLKKEEYGQGYGFALDVKKCKEHPSHYFRHKKRGKLAGDLCYFDFLICVCLSKRLGPRYYIFSRTELNKNPKNILNKSSHYTHYPYRIIIPVDAVSKDVGAFYEKIYSNPRDFLDRWDKIKDAMK
jgi:hypothetical protein